MLSDVLKLLARNESLSLTQLAQSLGYSMREIKAALDQLEHMGYVRHTLPGKSCGSSCSAGLGTGNCEGCSFSASGSYSSWILTERGKEFGSSQSKQPSNH